MKPHISDRVWVRLAELSPHDVDEATAARIRERAILALMSRPSSRAAGWARQAERIWTEFVELPVAGAVVVACLIWVFQGVANGRASDGYGRAGAAAIAGGRASAPALRAPRLALRSRRAAAASLATPSSRRGILR
ncbi:MAG TPA: hypothetical protein VK550_18285 [Polyangiaceae bacterium]|nr:hypothetical protein [Polyangiaceae bacterium]